MKRNLISVVQLKKDLKDDIISDEEYHKEIVDIFAKSWDFKHFEVIGEGAFSTVMKVSNENVEQGLAMKVVLKEKLGPKELQWGQLQNEYLLPLLETEYFDIFDLRYFVSPVVKLTVEDAIEKKVFTDDPLAFKMAVDWMQQITVALNYLHEKGLSFLNLKMSNIMITDDKRVKLFGFHRLNEIGELTTRYDVHDVSKPPETDYAVGNKAPVEGKAFDIWCLGVLSIEVFTSNYLGRNVPDDTCCWSDRVYPVMFKVLKKKTFNKECRSAFPNCNIKRSALKLIRNFCRACLRFAPEMRPNANILLRHKMFEDTGMLSEKDKIWKKLVKPKIMKQRLKNMTIFVVNAETATSNANMQTEIRDDDNVAMHDNDMDKSPIICSAQKNEEKEITVEEKLSNNPQNIEIDEISEGQVMSSESVHSINIENNCSNGNVDTYDNDIDKSPITCVVQKTEEKEITVEEKLSNNPQNIEIEDEISEGQLMSSESVHSINIENNCSNGNVDTHDNDIDKSPIICAAQKTEEKEIAVEEKFSNSPQNIEIEDEISESQVMCSKTAHSVNIFSLFQDMYCRTLLEHCDENLACRILHKENFVKAMKNHVMLKKNDEESKETITDMMKCRNSAQSSERTKGFGYQLASKLFQYFI